MLIVDALEHGRHREHGRDGDGDSERRVVGASDTDRHLPFKVRTSSAAAFGLIFGVLALFSALTAVLSPVAVVLGLLGLVLSIIGMKRGKREHRTGRGLAIGGLVTALLGLLLGGAVLAGAAALVNDDRQLDRLQQQIDRLRDNVPTGGQLRDSLPQ